MLSNFNNASSYSWILIGGGVDAPDAANCILDTNTVWGTNSGGGSFALSASGGNLVLTFTPSTSEPTTQASAIAFGAVSNNTITLSWASGNGVNRIVVGRAGSAVNQDPADSTTYTASAIFGSGTQIGTGNYVVYSGSGSALTVSNLTAETVYHFRVYEFNGSGGSENYLTSSAAGNPASRTTYAAEPSQATTLAQSTRGK